MALVVKNLSTNAGDIKDIGLIPESGGSLEEGMATLSNVLAWRIPWTEECGRLYSPCSGKESETTKVTACNVDGRAKRRLSSPRI